MVVQTVELLVIESDYLSALLLVGMLEFEKVCLSVKSLVRLTDIQLAALSALAMELQLGS